MKYITVKLTEQQAEAVIQALELDMNEDYPLTDSINAFIQRIINKIKKQLNS